MAEGVQRSLAESVEGTATGDFRVLDWGQLVLTAAIFGSSFLWIALALRSISPGLIAFGRVALGAAVVIAIPAARRSIGRDDWARMLLAAVLGMAAPVFLFALAEQRVSSALTGMLVAGIPIMMAAVAAMVTRILPTRVRVGGLAIGFVGILLVAAPELGNAGAEAVGVVMVLAGVLSYAISGMLYAPLQQTYGSLPVTLWLLLLGMVILAPLGFIGLGESSFEVVPVVSLLILGIIGTGVVWGLFVGLLGRVGAVRASLAGYLIPIVALVLGVAVLDERVQIIQVVGVLVAIAGGYLVSRGAEA